jgi:hypothetical protein
MCTEPDYDFPEAFIATMRNLDSANNTELPVKLAPDTETLVQKIAGQTGFSVTAVASALLNEGIAAFRSKGILF